MMLKASESKWNEHSIHSPYMYLSTQYWNGAEWEWTYFLAKHLGSAGREKNHSILRAYLKIIFNLFG